MVSAAGLEVDYVSLAAGAAARWKDVLCVATFDCAPSASIAASNIPVAEVRTPVLGSNGGVCEVWRTPHPIETGHRSRVHYRCTDQLLFGCISVSESGPPTRPGQSDASVPNPRRSPISAGRDNRDDPIESSTLYQATELAYREIFTTLDALDYPHLIRIWNYLPQINVATHGLERYRQFNSARRAALAASRRDFASNVPAACALGSVTGSPLVIYFLASRATPTLVENPRQVSAYEYPSQYGPKPAFSRATVFRPTSGAMLFISGTASIVGHETVHVGDVVAQTRETLTNIEALLSEANRVSGGPRFNMETLAYKVYVRNSADLPLIQSQLHSLLGPRAQLLYLQADVCREDLLVEIEAIGRDPD